jgi:hypothetical protein
MSARAFLGVLALLALPARGPYVVLRPDGTFSFPAREMDAGWLR